MATSRRNPRRLLAGLFPIALVAGALPLLAPTCGGTGEGTKTFARNSLIIPMDRCYQSQTDKNWTQTTTPAPASCPQAMDAGDVIKAYGLVYQLIRNDVAVYWVIDSAKTTADAEDFNIQYSGGFPAFLYDWATGTPGTAPTQQHVIRYRGGPFVVDGSDYAKASAVLQQYKTVFSAVNVHVSNVAFQGFVKKVMAGGWSAGGTVPPKLALLDIGSGNRSSSTPPTVSDPKNAEPVISNYLSKAGIGSGTAAGTATGTHGEIYDKLGIDDFQPEAGSTDWRTSNFGKNGYQILWVPHWLAPGSCSNFSSATNCAATLYSTAKTDQVLKTIGGFVAAGGDLFAECAGLGSFEGTFTRSSGQATTTYTSNYQDGDPSTRFQSTTGLRYSESGNEVSFTTPIRYPDPVNASSPPLTSSNFASPLLQIGDFVFKPVSGAIDVFRPNLTAPAPNTGAYQAGTIRLIAAQAPNELWDFFTLRPAAGDRGSIVYLGGHSYSGSGGEFQIGGTRLVLNTLFNLGAGCTESGVACDTGQLGVCALGRLQCAGDPPAPTCVRVKDPSGEICNGLDDNCNGLVDEGLETSCYDGPDATKNVGLCREGVRQCVQNPDGSYGLSACQGSVLPDAEVCNALDDDCDGQIDENLSEACYDGPPGSIDAESGQPKGACRPGNRTCQEGNWGSCIGQVLPQTPPSCTEGGGPTGGDVDCNGVPDDAACQCVVGQTQACYTGPTGTAGVGICKAGQRTCTASGWSACAGEQTPAAEACTNPGASPTDENCNGQTDEGCGVCVNGATRSCYSGPAGTAGKGICKAGTETCAGNAWPGSCVAEITPAAGEPCDGVDNDCDGVVDDGAVCATGYKCEVGVCVPAVCGTEQPCPEGYACQGAAGCKQVSGGCNGQTCPAGQACSFGACSDPCAGVTCGEGAVCASGACVGGACYFTGCPTGELCLEGACQADPCGGVNCPSGTFCRQGFCVQACTFVSCKAGERCGADGFCEPDACAGKTCSAGKICEGGTCVDDVCSGVGCGTGQVCKAGVCVDDPCAGVKCPAGACLDGQCFPTGNPTGVGSTPDKAKAKVGGCGCGADGGVGSLGALLALLAVPLARRRRGARGQGVAPTVVLLVAALAVAPGCKKSSKFDPSKCEAACEGENRCIDHQTDAFNCGTCGQACGEGNQCVDAVCGPTTAIAPRITSLSPDEAPNGSPEEVTLTVKGERFVEGAKLRAVTLSGAILIPTDPGGSSTQLTAKLDLEDESPTTWQIRVVNPNNVISNAKPLDVVVPSPTIASLAPTQVQAGKVVDLVVTGTGLGASSQCKIKGTQLLDTALPSEPGAGGTLVCTVDATLLPPGAYQLWVVNNGILESTLLPFTVFSPAPVLTAVSPSIGESGSVIAVTLYGSGFDLSSVALFDAVPVATTYIDGTLLLVSQLTLPVCGSGTCVHTLAVRNGAQVSGTQEIRAGAAPPSVSGLAPGTGYQGQAEVLTITGSGFVPGSFLEAAPPGGSFTALGSPSTPNCPGTCTSVVGTLDLTGKPEGSWLVRARYPDSSSSSAFSFRVLSNQAILRDATPRGGAQGESVPVVLTASNLRSPFSAIRVVFDGQVLTPSSTPAGTTVNVSLNLAGKNTGTYAIAVRNPNGAADSNGLSFNVTPGPPTLQGPVVPASAVRQDAPVEVTLTGTNFAKPDPAGNGGTTVHISNPAVGVTDYMVPKAATTIVSPTQLKVSLQTLDGVPAKYDVTVWNPGGPTPPQKSNTLVQAFEILP